MEFPDALRYSAEHEWVAVDGTTARVGITDFAQDALGDVVYVSVPDVGATVAANGACGEVESTKSVSDIFTPVSGSVTEVNDALNDTPELLNQQPVRRRVDLRRRDERARRGRRAHGRRRVPRVRRVFVSARCNGR